MSQYDMVPYGQPTPLTAEQQEVDKALSLFVDRQAEMNRAAKGAYDVIDRPLDSFLWWPWHALHKLTGSIPPEEFWIIAGMSGAGKTTLLMSLLDLWAASDVSVVYVGLENSPKTLLIHLACRRLALRGIFLHPGDVLKGRLREGHPEYLENAAALRDAVRAEVHFIRTHLSELVRFVPIPYLTDRTVHRVCEQCAAWGVRAIIVDHLDHMDAEDGSGTDFEQHKAVLNKLHAATRKYGITIIGAAQMNSDALKRPGGSLRAHQRPSTEMVNYGMLKRRISDIMLIIFRGLPIAPENADDAEAYKAAMRILREDGQQLDRYLVPNTMSVLLEKDRAYGQEGKITTLGVRAARICDANPFDAQGALDRLLSLSMPAVAAFPKRQAKVANDKKLIAQPDSPVLQLHADSGERPFGID